MTERDLAQHANQMVVDLSSFLEGGMSIDQLSTVLKIRIAAMAASGADPAWVDECRSLRNEIEYINAFWLESGRPHLDDEESRAAREAAQELSLALSRNDATGGPLG
ncbi:MAG: hypothetical protein IT193_16965 [Propionibacteriaceae bacterium]|nr:hypothetical protein [Propionibacteriaceae bacterium]